MVGVVETGLVVLQQHCGIIDAWRLNGQITVTNYNRVELFNDVNAPILGSGTVRAIVSNVFLLFITYVECNISTEGKHHGVSVQGWVRNVVPISHVNLDQVGIS